ncbi:MAG: hypothetical protein ACRDSJ_12325 [Rubrobacteraceae bacterium]
MERRKVMQINNTHTFRLSMIGAFPITGEVRPLVLAVATMGH